MKSKIFNIQEFSNYININGLKNADLHIVNFDTQKKVLLKSNPITIDFYLLAIKPHLNDSTRKNSPLIDNISDSAFMYVDCPQNSLEWDIEPPMEGYAIMISSKYLDKHAKEYSFARYNNHEALFLSKEEEIILFDLYKKAEHEFSKELYSTTVVISYINLILTYVKIFYDRQFDSRSEIYHKVIAEFHKGLEDYFNKNESVPGLPSVAYFAQKNNLSANYFGDLIKHFTGKAPIDHIQDYIILLAKEKLKTSSLSVSEISYSLGFDYPNYFARFFRKKTGVSPKEFRSQQ